MSTAALTAPLVPLRRTPYSRILARARSLGVPAAVVEGCLTMGDLKPLIRTAFLLLARRFHPDMMMQRHVRARMTGDRFRYYQRRYEWCMQQPDSLRLLRPAPSVPDIALPWAMEPHALLLGYGWQEDRSVRWWQ